MSKTSDERQLIRRAKQGEAAAFAEIYERHHAAVFRYILYRVANEAVAEELAAEVFVRVVTKICTFVDRGRPILAWLYTIARNLVIDHRRRSAYLAVQSLDERIEGTSPDPVVAADQAFEVQRLSAALEQLTEDQRQVILLKFVEEMDNGEAALILGKPVGAIKSLQHRALNALRRLLER